MWPNLLVDRVLIIYLLRVGVLIRPSMPGWMDEGESEKSKYVRK